MNDYAFQILHDQRHDEFIAEAANDRLVRTATSGRPNWRRRVLGGVHRPGAVRSHTARPAQVH